MPLEQTVTIINNSGKIISSGKQLLSIFKEAKASYDDKKAELKAERFALNRAQTFDIHPSPTHHRHYYPHDTEELEYYHQADFESFDRSRPPVSRHGRRFDEVSEASTRRSAKPRRSRSVSGRSHVSGASGRYPDYPGQEPHRSFSKPALTETNLKTFSEVSSEAPSRVPYRSPYAETIPLDAVMSKLDITHAELRRYAQENRSVTPPEQRNRRSMSISRRQSEELSFAKQADRSYKEIDMDLAYGNVPPDLEDRIDLDPAYQEMKKEERAQALVRKIEGLLDEAHCVQHSATSMITHLQKNPDAAASVALTLAELSSAVGKMSPAFLALLKGGSPAVFGLLASPQFLIGSGIAVGVTVVMFGGWKIVKKVKEQHAAREAIALAAEGPYASPHRPLPMRTQTASEFSEGIDEALVVDDELSTIETWRRGIMPYGVDNESADYELITPEARRANKVRSSKRDGAADTRSLKSERTGEKKNKNAGSGSVYGGSSRNTKGGDGAGKRSGGSGSSRAGSSVAGSSSGRKSGSTKRKMKAIDDGTRSRMADEEVQSVFKSKEQRHGNLLKAVFKKKQKARSEVMIV